MVQYWRGRLSLNSPLLMLCPVEHRFRDPRRVPHPLRRWGRSDTLLLLHGNPSWSFLKLYRNITVAPRNNFRRVALDSPGYGLSYAPAACGWER